MMTRPPATPQVSGGPARPITAGHDKPQLNQSQRLPEEQVLTAGHPRRPNRSHRLEPVVAASIVGHPRRPNQSQRLPEEQVLTAGHPRRPNRSHRLEPVVAASIVGHPRRLSQNCSNAKVHRLDARQHHLHDRRHRPEPRHPRWRQQRRLGLRSPQLRSPSSMPLFLSCLTKFPKRRKMQNLRPKIHSRTSRRLAFRSRRAKPLSLSS